MFPTMYDLAKERAADRFMEAERYRMVQEAKAAARQERATPATSSGARERQTWWARFRGKFANVPNTSITRPAR
jgi:hypothetical protein